MRYDKYEITSMVYDAVNSHVDRGAWADAIEGDFRKYCKTPPRLVLDLGCGTGTLTLLLAERGYDMTGVDSSPEMLSLARENEARMCPDGGVLWLLQDMSDFELYGTVDAVISTCDALNYLITDADIKRCLSLVHNYLIPDGIFVFDVASRGKFRRNYGGRDLIFEGDGYFCGWRSAFSERTGIARFDLTYFIEHEGGWVRFDETQRQRCRSVRSIKRLLSETGFDLLGISRGYDADGGNFDIHDEDSPDVERIRFAARVHKTETSGNKV
ncbi:MAG: class I SAM-dependent methyltransferase [Firmicutes bacterium]|nr:class I SAM-dependent methyltransferase [Bacillota bacterium]